MAAQSDAYLALGSNVGDREAHLAHALRRLAAGGDLAGLSSVYETEPVDYLDQPRFLNMVVALRTPLSPAELLTLARSIEGERGRERAFRGGPRTLDVDILLYGDRLIQEPGLEVPHPRMADRPFVLVPLLELDGSRREPGTGARYENRLAALRIRAAAEAAAGAGDEKDEGGLRSLGLRRVFDGERLLDEKDT